MGEDDRRVGIAECLRFTASSAPSIWRWVRDGTFPAPTYLKGRRTWTVAQLRAWITAEGERPQNRGRNLAAKFGGNP